MSGSRRLTRMLFALDGALALWLGYLLALLVAAHDAAAHDGAGAGAEALEQGLPLAPPGEPQACMRLVVLVPAHDEELGIGATLASLAACEYPSDRRRVVAIADNCTDATAARARLGGAEVWERVEPDRHGKGFALSWALRRLAAEGCDFDAVVMLDADCVVSANMLTTVAGALRDGAEAVQVSYEVENPCASHVSALRFAAFALMHVVRPLGKQRLGLSCGLFGTGIAFSRELLERQPWRETGLVEDGEYHLRLVAAGERVRFLPEAWVRSAMPTSLRASNVQQSRWERGKLGLIRRWSPQLLLAGLARRDPVRLHAAFEQLVPPQSLIAAAGAGSALAGLARRERGLLACGLAALGAQLAFVLAGLRLVGAPGAVYRALPAAPALIVSKVFIYARFLVRRGPTGWVRTEREATPGR